MPTASMAGSWPPATGSHGRWRLAVYERLGADVGPLSRGLAPKLRTSHGPSGTRLALIWALLQLGGFA